MKDNKDHHFNDMSKSVKEFIGDMKTGGKQTQDAESTYSSGYVDGAGMAISGMLHAARLGLSLSELVAVTDAYGRDLELWVRGSIPQPQFTLSYYLSHVRKANQE